MDKTLLRRQIIARVLPTRSNQKFKHPYGCFNFWFWVEWFGHLQRMLQKVRNQVDFGSVSAPKSLRVTRSVGKADRANPVAPQLDWCEAIAAAPIREYTIRKIIKTEFLSPRVFIDFSYCVSRHPVAPTKVNEMPFGASFCLVSNIFTEFESQQIKICKFFQLSNFL